MSTARLEQMVRAGGKEEIVGLVKNKNAISCFNKLAEMAIKLL